jgi:phage/plasmid-associated DNA primase
VPASSREIARQWERAANNVREFCDGFEVVEDHWRGTTGQAIYNAYKLHCTNTGSRPLGRNNLFAELQREGWSRSTSDKERRWLVRPTPGGDVAQLFRAAAESDPPY